MRLTLSGLIPKQSLRPWAVSLPIRRRCGYQGRPAQDNAAAAAGVWEGGEATVHPRGCDGPVSVVWRVVEALGAARVLVGSCLDGPRTWVCPRSLS